MISRIMSVFLQIVLKIRYGKRLKINSVRQIIRLSSKIQVGKTGYVTLGGLWVQPNVYIKCSCGELSIGNGVSFNRNCVVVCRKKITIGDNCLFGPNVCIFDNDHLINENGVSKDQFKCSDIIIENGCWIGAGCIILRGTHIGENTVIEAGMVVKGNIPPISVVMSTRESRAIPMSFFKEQNVKC